MVSAVAAMDEMDAMESPPVPVRARPLDPNRGAVDAPPGAASHDATALERVLRDRFALPSFRPWQLEAIDALLGGPGRVLVVAPTGGGKSLTYQLPAAVLPGLTIVISPLIALMEDQVRALCARGVPATMLTSHISPEERRVRARALRSGEYKLLYCAPERLASEAFVDFLASCEVSLVAVDEAHCIAQWGHDFRPDYLRIGDLLARLRPPRILACTATATRRVREEIRARLGLEGAKEVLRGFARPNLHLSARSVDRKRDVRSLLDAALHDALGPPKQRTRRGTAIVYCATRKMTEEIAGEVSARGWKVAAYHAGLDADVRGNVNKRFAEGGLDVVVATNAFGMGIDRADVRTVVHVQPPGSLEAYYQEVGRAGRDGEEAHGLLLCTPSDVAVRRRLCEWGSGGPAPAEVAARAWALFRELLEYLDAGTCRHDFILRYFGDEREVLGGCGHCDVCAVIDGGATETDEVRGAAAVEVRKALAGVARANRRGGIISVGEMLRGEATERVTRFGFDALSTFGLLKHRSQAWIVALLRSLLAAGWIDLTPTEGRSAAPIPTRDFPSSRGGKSLVTAHPVPYVTPTGWKVMTGDGAIRLRMPPDHIEAGTRRQRTKPPRGSDASNGETTRERSDGRGDPTADLTPSDRTLFDALRAHRIEVARERKLPPYVVAPDVTLADIARVRPKNEIELLTIKGMGPYRVEAYGGGLLDVVGRHAEA